MEETKDEIVEECNEQSIEIEEETQTYIDPKTGKEIQTIVIRKEHKHFLWFWKLFYSVMGFLEVHIPHNILQFLKYSIFSACAGAVELITNLILNFSLEGVRLQLGMVHWIVQEVYITNLIATLVGLALGVLCNIVVNRKLTFRSSGNFARALMFVIAFYIVVTPLKTMWNSLLPPYLEGAMGYAGASTFIDLCGMFIIGCTEFLYQKFIVYRKEENSALRKDK